MVYAMHPAGEVQPVQVDADDTIGVLVDGLDALGLLGDGFLDAEWLGGDTGSVAVADGDLLGRALARYAALSADGAVEAALRQSQCPPGAADIVEQFFSFVAETSGHDLVIEHLR